MDCTFGHLAAVAEILPLWPAGVAVACSHLLASAADEKTTQLKGVIHARNQARASSILLKVLAITPRLAATVSKKLKVVHVNTLW